MTYGIDNDDEMCWIDMKLYDLVCLLKIGKDWIIN